MKRDLLDSNAVTSLINQREPFIQRVREARLSGGRIGTCEPDVAELHYGLALSSSREKNLVRLRRGLSGLIVWPLDRCASEFYGEIAADLRRRGRPMQVIDMLLAAVARSLGDCTVITTDSDLLAIPGLSVENWDVTRPS